MTLKVSNCSDGHSFIKLMLFNASVVFKTLILKRNLWKSHFLVTSWVTFKNALY